MDTKLQGAIAKQMMSGSSVEVQGESVPVRHTGAQHLKTVAFSIDGSEFTAIEQNPEKLSQWGKLVRSGHQVVQFKDNERNRSIAVSVDGQVKEYGKHSSIKPLLDFHAEC
jgi:hypothetical protein